MAIERERFNMAQVLDLERTENVKVANCCFQCGYPIRCRYVIKEGGYGCELVYHPHCAKALSTRIMDSVEDWEIDATLLTI